MEQKSRVSKAGTPVLLILRETRFKITLTWRITSSAAFTPLLFKSVFVEHLVSRSVWILGDVPCCEILQWWKRGQEGTRSLAQGGSTGSTQQTSPQPLCLHLQLGGVMEQSHRPGTAFGGGNGTGEERVKEAEEQQRCEMDEKRWSRCGRMTCARHGLVDHPLSRASSHVHLGLGLFEAFWGFSALQQM